MDIVLKVLPYLVNILSGIILACATYTINKARKGHEDAQAKAEDQEKALSEGVQALLRESIVNSYNKHAEKGFCPIYAKESVKGLRSAAGFIRRELFARLKMRKSPELHFIADDSIARGAEVTKKLEGMTFAPDTEEDDETDLD